MPEPGPAQPAGVAHCFVYYRVAEKDLPAATRAVLDFQASLRTESPALSGALMRRPGATEGLVTLMETYLVPADWLAPAGQSAYDGLRERLASGPAALLPWLRSARHLEEFVPCA